MFKSFDVSVNPQQIDWTKINLPGIIEDKALYERERGNIEDYVAELNK